MKSKQSYSGGFRLLTAASMTLLLVACGGGSGDGGTDGSDIIDDVTLIDTDPNGDHDGDGVENFRDFDLTRLANGTDDDFDGVDDAFQTDTVTDGDGTDNGGGGSLDGCAGNSAISNDTNSSTADWGDNCQLESGGTHANSSYTRGVQQLLNCLGYPLAVDGSFGPNTQSAVESFQTDNPPLTSDGIVGPQTWGALQDTLVSSVFDVDVDGFSADFYDPDGDSVDNRLGSCIGSDTELFYQNINSDGVGTSWTMDQGIGTEVMVPFSIDP